jgi:hypothetical protein
LKNEWASCYYYGYADKDEFAAGFFRRKQKESE